MRLKAIVSGLTELIYPSRATCLGCGSAAGFDEPWLCPDCRAALAQRWVGAFPDKKMDGCAAAYLYAGPAGGVVRSLKFHGVRAAVGMMAADMARAAEALEPMLIDAVTAVPMHPKREKARGFNHAELLARAFAEQRGLPYRPLITRTRNTPQQAMLEDEARRTNLKGAFCGLEEAQGLRVMLVDDVYTTGETARQCARALYAAGAVDVYFVSYAKG